MTAAKSTLAMSFPAVLLRVEGITVFIGALAAYGVTGGNWWVFALLLLSPDLAMIGYLVNTRVGAVSYNIVHSYTLPLILLAVSYSSGQTTLMHLAIIWLAHIGMDRTVGYGLKYTTAFKDTHLNRS